MSLLPTATWSSPRKQIYFPLSSRSPVVVSAPKITLTSPELVVKIAGSPGTAGQVLTSTGTTAIWTENPPGNIAGWSNFAAETDVDLSGHNIRNVQTLYTNNISEKPGLALDNQVFLTSNLIMPEWSIEASNIQCTEVDTGIVTITEGIYSTSLQVAGPNILQTGLLTLVDGGDTVSISPFNNKLNTPEVSTSFISNLVTINNACALPTRVLGVTIPSSGGQVDSVIVTPRAADVGSYFLVEDTAGSPAQIFQIVFDFQNFPERGTFFIKNGSGNGKFIEVFESNGLTTGNTILPPSVFAVPGNPAIIPAPATLCICLFSGGTLGVY